jgi:hypothetical protein
VIATRSDACIVRLRRDGVDPETARRLGALLGDPAFAALAARVGGRYGDLEQLTQALVDLSSPGALAHGDFDLQRGMEVLAASDDPEGALARALAGLFVLAALEGLTRRYGPPTEYPGMAVTSIELVGLPAARWLQEAGATAAAATLATLLRHYMISDPAQRAMPEGKRAIAACREIESARARQMADWSRQVAWSLRSRMDEEIIVRVSVASLYFVLGDALRARWIMAEQHRPSLGALVDLVAVRAELAPLDPLLQAVWLLTLGEAKPDVPDDLRFHLRAVVPEVNGHFKGADEAAKRTLGMSYSQAYAEGLFGFLVEAWDEDTTKTRWWSVFTEAMKLPPAMLEYRSGFARLLELYSLAFKPGVTLPGSGTVAAFAGVDAYDRDDLREVATLSLRLDGWTAQHGQLGRSVAYDSSFLIEPDRREEPVARSIELLEEHRHASLEWWLAVVPPLTEEPSKRRRRRIADEDRELAHEYRSLAYVSTLREAPLYARVYGQGSVRRVIDVPESDRVRRLIECDERRARWQAQALEAWPEYGYERASMSAGLTDVGHLLGIG